MNKRRKEVGVGRDIYREEERRQYSERATRIAIKRAVLIYAKEIDRICDLCSLMSDR